ncbi:tyrosine-type recombinase/integrase [Negativibacillus massiliensis]|uniref:tyrosine-type recombinase/integrase n=1 Tax=Negativibacillus massiliensis TaxID=1871035 RepID=UPI002A7F7EFA|nr:tyrosine-type recombinase/integrase [Negativibacillus massiliensis]MDY4046527.1 tyrosine-type recombinase/integrase [Negativibacillus massiliensis]
MDKNILQECPDLLREFLFYLETIQGRSPKTVSGYYIELRTFFRYIKSVKVLKNVPENAEQLAEIKIDDITKELICGVTLSDIYDFLHFSMNVLGNNASSRSRKISSIRALYKYLTTKTNYLEENPAKNLDTPSMRKSVPKYLTLGESIELLASIQDESPAVTARDYCMITLMLNCGMRVSELVGINLEDIRDNTLRLLGKGNKERMVYLNDACLSAIENYLKFRKQPEGGPDKNALFLSSQHRRMTTRRVEQIVAKYLKACGLDGRGYSPHKLRHTAATLMYQHGGVDIRALKEILGHANIGTTEIYTHISDRMIEEAANASPLSSVKRKLSEKELLMQEVEKQNQEEQEGEEEK